MSHDPNATPTPISDTLRAHGRWNPNWDPIAQVDDVWMEKFLTMGTHAMHVLDPKTYELMPSPSTPLARTCTPPVCAPTSAGPWTWV